MSSALAPLPTAEAPSPAESYPTLHALAPCVPLRGSVVRGFGRGSKELGIPTANLDAERLGAVLESLPAGVYFGWASVGASEEAHKMVMSIGWCVCTRAGCGGLCGRASL